MKRKILFGLLWMVPSYCIGLFGSLWLLPMVTTNRHDPELEAAMAGAFVFGPLAACFGFIAAAVTTKHNPADTAER